MTRDFLVSNKLGMHARPAAMFVKTANRFDCSVMVEKDGETVIDARKFEIETLSRRQTVHITRNV